MNKPIITTLAVASLLSIGCATTRPVGQQLDDSMTTSRVGHRLSMDPDVQRTKIDIDTIDGVVTLRGEVPDETARDEAVEVASRTRGVKTVRDELHVRDAKKERDGDVATTLRVNNRLLNDPDVKSRNVDVDTYDGVVTLSGIVESDAARREAGLLATQTEGVRAVDNQLRVEQTPRVARVE